MGLTNWADAPEGKIKKNDVTLHSIHGVSLWPAQLIANDSGVDMEQAGKNTCYVLLKIFILVSIW